MEKILFYIIIFLFMLIILLSNNKREFFYPGNTLKNKKRNLVMNIKTEKKIKQVLKEIGLIERDVNKGILEKVNTLTANNVNNLNNWNFNNLIDMIIIIFIVQGNIDSKISKNNLKKLLYQYFGNYALLKVTQKNRYFNNDPTLEDGLSIQIPIDVIQRINWQHYEAIFHSINPKKELTFHDIISIKKNILLQQFLDNQIPTINTPIIYDKNTNNYNENYLKIIESDKETNYTTKEGKDHNLNFMGNFTTNYMIELYERLQMKKKNKKLIYKKIYLNMVNDENIPFSLIFGNIYLPSQNFLDKILDIMDKKKNQILAKNFANVNQTNYLSSVDYYPLRFQKPLNYNCQRVWDNCWSKDRINDYYHYYKYDNQKSKMIKTDENSRVSFSTGIYN